MLTAEPALTMFLHDNPEPKLTKSKTDSWLEKRVKLRQLSALPSDAADRMLMLAPRFTPEKTLIELPARPSWRSDRELLIDT